MTESLGKLLLDSIDEALANKDSVVTVYPKIVVSDIRKNLGLTQVGFATRFHIKLNTLRQWEQGARSPDYTSIAYLKCIEKEPELIKNILSGNK